MDYPLDEYEMLAKDIEHCLANNNADKLSDGDPDRIRQLLAALEKWAKHKRLCAVFCEKDKACDCGRDAAIAKARGSND